MSNVAGFSPKVVGISRQEEEYKASALRVLDYARELIETGGYAAVALVALDMEGAGTQIWSKLPHHAATIGLIQTLSMRIAQHVIDDNPVGLDIA